MAAAAAATATAASSVSALASLASTPLTAIATPPTPKVHQNEMKISKPISTEQSLLIQDRSLKKVAMTMTNVINKPTAAATANAHSDNAATPNQIATNEIDLTAPQSIAYVGGRKFIMVPKAAKIHTSPDLANDKSFTKSS